MNLKTKRLIISDIQSLDINDVYEIYSDKEVCKYFDCEPFTNIKQAEQHILNWIEKSRQKKQFRYSIRYQEKTIGTVGLYNIYWHNNRASLGFDLNREYWGMGIMSEAVSELINYWEKEFTLNRIEALVMPENIASVKLLLKNGFEYEGLLKEYEMWPSKGYVDLAIYSKLLKKYKETE